MPLPNRKHLRLNNYDYSNENYYFITICTHNKQYLFGNPTKLNNAGKIAQKELLNIQEHFPDIKIHKYVVMPNHIHAIVIIGCEAKTERSRPFPTLSTIIGLYKSTVSKHIHKTQPIQQIWQKSFYDRIIRNQKEYEEIWKYIDANPYNWENDDLYIQQT